MGNPVLEVEPAGGHFINICLVRAPRQTVIVGSISCCCTIPCF